MKTGDLAQTVFYDPTPDSELDKKNWTRRHEHEQGMRVVGKVRYD